ncbi:30S ribosomal protein S2, partial [Treponema sp.]
CNPEGIDYPIPGNDDAIRAITLFTSIIANAVIEADNDAGLKIIENLGDDDESVQTDAVKKNEDEEIVDYSNYQPTEQKEEDVEADEKDSFVDEDKLYK